jgi:hypothetical protein
VFCNEGILGLFKGVLSTTLFMQRGTRDGMVRTANQGGNMEEEKQ